MTKNDGIFNGAIVYNIPVRELPTLSNLKIDYFFRQDLWHPEPGSYELTDSGWALYQEQQRSDIESLKSAYPELSHWGDLERLNAWGEFCFDINLTVWTEPYRTEDFLEYLKLAQSGKLPDSNDREAVLDYFLSIQKANKK